MGAGKVSQEQGAKSGPNFSVLRVTTLGRTGGGDESRQSGWCMKKQKSVPFVLDQGKDNDHLLWQWIQRGELQNGQSETSLVVQWLRNCLAIQGMRVWSPVKEPRSHMPGVTKPVHTTEHALQWKMPRAAAKTQQSQKIKKQTNENNGQLLSWVTFVHLLGHREQIFTTKIQKTPKRHLEEKFWQALQLKQKNLAGNFPDGPVVKTARSQSWGYRFHPCSGN